MNLSQWLQQNAYWLLWTFCPPWVIPRCDLCKFHSVTSSICSWDTDQCVYWCNRIWNGGCLQTVNAEILQGRVYANARNAVWLSYTKQKVITPHLVNPIIMHMDTNFPAGRTQCAWLIPLSLFLLSLLFIYYTRTHRTSANKLYNIGLACLTSMLAVVIQRMFEVVLWDLL